MHLRVPATRGGLLVLNPLLMQLSTALGHRTDRMGGARGPTLNSFQLCTKGSLRKCDCSGVFQPIGGAVGLWEPLFAAVGGAVWASPSPAQLSKREGTALFLKRDLETT